ncbi:MAG: hypothetical protein NC399_03390 [Muribaculum sp.]|nr:hypothetical protein [Muribaculum sp.]
MSMMFGMGGMNRMNAGVTQITLKRADGTAAGTITVRRSTRSAQKQKQKKKKLEYSCTQVSGEILQTKTSGNASQVLTRNRARVAMLRRKYVTGQYDEQEVASAILHAEAMVRAARKRMKHLRAEEAAKRGMKTPEEEAQERERTLDLTGIPDEEQALQDEADRIRQEIQEELSREMRRLMAENMRETMEKLAEETMRAMEEAMDMEELSDDLACAVDSMEPQDLEQLKKKHRADEQREIMEANMKYLKAMFDRLEKEKQEGSSGLPGSGGDYTADTAGVTLELAGADIPVADVAAIAAEAAGGNVDIAL